MEEEYKSLLVEAGFQGTHTTCRATLIQFNRNYPLDLLLVDRKADLSVYWAEGSKQASGSCCQATGCGSAESQPQTSGQRLYKPDGDVNEWIGKLFHSP